jgi:hypothetical protein
MLLLLSSFKISRSAARTLLLRIVIYVTVNIHSSDPFLSGNDLLFFPEDPEGRRDQNKRGERQ